jgi:hypothetical protein
MQPCSRLHKTCKKRKQVCTKAPAGRFRTLGTAGKPTWLKCSPKTRQRCYLAERHSSQPLKGTQCPGLLLGHPVPGAYTYGDLALQVGGVSDVTVKYGCELCGTSAQKWLLWQGPEVILQQITDPSSRQRGRYKITKPQLSKGHFKAKETLVAGP